MRSTVFSADTFCCEIVDLRLILHLNRAYRFLGQALCWILFGLIGLVVCFVISPLILLFVRNRRQRQVAMRAVIRAGFRVFVGLVRALRLVTFRLTGMEHYDPSESQLIAANHPTLIDVVILIALFPGVDCVIKESITRNPFLGMAVRAANYIPNDASTDWLGAAAERLASGARLILFPEGTRTVRGEAMRFKAGAAEVVLRSGARILPVVIDCRPPFLGKREPWYRTPETTPHFEIRILPSMGAGELVGLKASNRQARRELNLALQRFFESQLG